MKRNATGMVFLLMCIMLAALFTSACSDTFVITKDGKSYFFGSKREGFYKMLCESGDLKTIIAETQLPSKTQDDLYRFNCVLSEQSKEKVGEIYISMTPEQRRDLRLAFQNHGYDINYMEC
ncbi:MAG: hypothetical protein HQL08_03700 [Nitrospirae bacterium]|nr:hypothetical protein [Nitrospirota bacterium]